MLRAVLSLVRWDIEQQARWAAGEARRRGRSVGVTVALIVTAFMALIGAASIGCIALYTWVASEHGELVGLGIVAALLGGVALVLIAIALLRPEHTAVPRPLVQATDTHVLKGALARDMSVAGDQALALAKGSRIGQAIIAGEEAFKTGSTIYRAARAQLSGHRTSTVVGSLAVVAVLGLVLGRRIRTTYPRPSS